MKRADTKAQALFDACFKILSPPDAPKLTIQELENELILVLENPTSSNNYREEYEEIDEINDSKEITQSMMDDKIDDMVYDVKRDPLDYLKNLGYDIKDYINEDELAQGLVDSDGWGIMNSYDGNYDSEDVNGVSYYIMRIN